MKQRGRGGDGGRCCRYRVKLYIVYDSEITNLKFEPLNHPKTDLGAAI